MSDFRVEVEKLRDWLAIHQWVDCYDRWWPDGGVVSTLEVFLAEVPPQVWSEQNVTDLLYVLEQASTDDIVEMLTRDEPMGLAIARHSLARGGIASDDIATRLGYCVNHRNDAEALLLEFIRDSHEPTRRRALLALAELRSTAVPAQAVAAWHTGEEYPRIGALAALEKIGSDLFPLYLQLALQDGRTNLAALARRYVDAQG